MKINQSVLLVFVLLNLTGMFGYGQREIYEIQVYDLNSADQVTATDKYLENALLPVLHRQGIKLVGVFKPLANDTAATRKIITLVAYSSLDNWKTIQAAIGNDPAYQKAANFFTNADTAHLPFQRRESTLLLAFPDQPRLIQSGLKSNPDAIYELRSYESPTEKLHQLKVNMFNTGGEIALFKRLDFQAIFYADVLIGNKMPNLVYMVSFASLAAREEHWKAFGSSPEWKALTADLQWENNISVSHIDSYLMKRTAYSDL